MHIPVLAWRAAARAQATLSALCFVAWVGVNWLPQSEGGSNGPYVLVGALAVQSLLWWRAARNLRSGLVAIVTILLCAAQYVSAVVAVSDIVRSYGPSRDQIRDEASLAIDVCVILLGIMASSSAALLMLHPKPEARNAHEQSGA